MKDIVNYVYSEPRQIFFGANPVSLSLKLFKMFGKIEFANVPRMQWMTVMETEILPMGFRDDSTPSQFGSYEE